MVNMYMAYVLSDAELLNIIPFPHPYILIFGIVTPAARIRATLECLLD